MTWIKFHDTLCWGGKRAIPRAWRFVFMELALMAYDKRGYIELPPGFGDFEAVAVMLGGDKKEVLGALRCFTSGVEPSIWFEGETNARRLLIRNWHNWNTSTEKSTQRTRKHRLKGTTSDGDDDEDGGSKEQIGNGSETVPGTLGERLGNGQGTLPPLSSSSDPQVDHFSSGEQIPTDPLLAADLKTTSQVTTRAKDQPEPRNPDPWNLRSDGGDPDEAPSETRTDQILIDPSGKRRTAIEAVWDGYLDARSKFLGGVSGKAAGGRPPVLTPDRRKRIRDRLREFSAEDLALACRGIWATKFNTDNNHTGIEVALRSAEKVELYMRNAVSPPKDDGARAVGQRPPNRHDFVQQTPEGGRLWKSAAPVDLSQYADHDEETGS